MSDSIRIEETDDSVLIAALNEEVQSLHFDLHPEVFKRYDQQEVKAAMRDLMAEKNCKALLAMDEETPIGYALLFIRNKPENAFQHADRWIHLDQLCVLSKYRHQGVGRTLLTHVHQLANDLDIERIALDHWSANYGARQFFTKTGFRYFNERMELLVSS